MSIAINSNFERDQYVAAAGQVQFTFSFPIFDETYLTVYQRPGAQAPNDALDVLTLGVDYSVTGAGEEAGGFITLTAGAGLGDIITVVGEEPIERESVFPDYNPFTVALNQQLNEQTVMQQQTYTYWNHVTPRYYFSELVSNAVRPLKRILPMLPDGHVWVGRGEIGDNPDDITTAFFGAGSVTPAHPGMRPSIAVWTGTDFVLDDSNLTIMGNTLLPNVGDTIIFGGSAITIPVGPTANRPIAPTDGALRFNSTTNFPEIFIGGNWVNLLGGGAASTLKYVVNEADPSLPNAQSLGDLNTGIVFNTKVGPVGTLSTLPVVPLALGGTQTVMTAPPADALFSWDFSDGAAKFLAIGTGLAIVGDTLINTGSSGGGTTTRTVTQMTHGLIAGNWVRINTSGNYVKAIATTPEFAEVIGLVINKIDDDHFILQTEGFVSAGTFTGLVLTGTYFLSDVTPGLMTLTVPTANNSIRMSLFNAETATSGVIHKFLPIIIGGTPNIVVQPGGDTPSIVNVTQPGNTFVVGDWLYVSGFNGVNPVYSKGIATSLATSQVVGVVITAGDPVFTLQTEGHNVGAVTVDFANAAIIQTGTYYLSATDAGRLVQTPPSRVDYITKPLYISEQTIATTGVTAGYIIPQRPLAASLVNNPSVQVITQNSHGLHLGDVVRLDSANHYIRAQANTLQNSQACGVIVFVPDANTFYLQTEGFTTGSITLASGNIALVAAGIYYLSATDPGRVTITEPNVPGQISVRIFICSTIGANATGYIVPQRPIPVIVPVGGGGQYVLISNNNITNQSTVNLLGQFAGYKDIQIIGTNLVFQEITGGSYFGKGFGLRYEIASVIQSSANYRWNATTGSLVITTSIGFYNSPGGDPNIYTPQFLGSSFFPFNFTLTIYGVNSTNTAKVTAIKGTRCNNVSVPLVTTVNQDNTGYFATNTGAVTGVQFLFDAGDGPYRIVSGNISVYGIPI